jgi:hypothetical protein
MSDDDARVPDAWINYCAGVVYDLHRAGILETMDDMTDEEIRAALAKVRKSSYNRPLAGT